MRGRGFLIRTNRHTGRNAPDHRASYRVSIETLKFVLERKSAPDQCVIPDFTSAGPVAPPWTQAYCRTAVTPGNSLSAAKALLICSPLRTSTVNTMCASERRL